MRADLAADHKAAIANERWMAWLLGAGVLLFAVLVALCN